MVYIRSYKEIENHFIFKFFNFLNIFASNFYNIKLKNIENIPQHNKSVIYISRHTTHNYDIFPGLFLFFKFYKKPIRGIGFVLIDLFLPHYKYCGVVVGNKSNVNKLIDNNEIIYIMPGGAEESTVGSENAYKVNWISKSGNYRMGFTKIATERDIEIIPVAGENTEEMVFAPFIFLANLFYITKLFDYLCKLPGIIGLIFYYIKLTFSCFFGALLIIPIPVSVTLHIGTPLKKNEDESLLEFTKRCENKLQSLYLKTNKSYNKNILYALKQRFIKYN
jgi:hypothetical protein